MLFSDETQILASAVCMSAQPFDAVQGGGLEGGQGGGDDRQRVAGDSHRLPQLSQRRVIAVKRSDTTILQAQGLYSN